jgi:uncharacterized protein YlxP (DUF503 family)
MFVGALRVELFFGECHSLKEKRGHVKPVVDGLRHRFAVAAAESGFQDLWQRCEIGVAAVGSTASHVDDVLDQCERFVWSFPEHVVVRCERRWLDPD